MADNNIIIKITSEADLSAAQRQLQDMESAAYDLTKQMANLKKAEAEEVAEIKKQAKEWSASKTAVDAFNKKIKEVEDKYKNVILAKKEEIKVNKQSIAEYNKQIKSYKQLQGEGGKMVQQLRAMREELQRMEDAGQFGTQAFMDLSVAAAKLQDQIGDTQARIQVLASDTLALDTAIGAADGLVGAFSMATSAVALFGGESEELEKAFYKVQAAMSVLNGAQQLANAFNKDSVLSVVTQIAMEKLRRKEISKSAAATATQTAATGAQTAATGAQTAATGAATAAQWSLNAAMEANPIGAIVALVVACVAAVAALGYGIYKLADAFSASAKAQRKYEKTLEEIEAMERNLAINSEIYAHSIEARANTIERQYNREILAARQRGASEMELLEIEKTRAEENQRLNAQRQAQYDREKAYAESQLRAYEEALAAVNATAEGTRARREREEQLQAQIEKTTQAAAVANATYRAMQEADMAVSEADLAIIEKRLELEKQLTQSEINLMREGQSKELAQLRLNYQERLDEIKGNSIEEMALRASLLAEQAKEETAIRRKYALEAKATELQEKKNLLKEMEQLGGTEEEYAKQLELRKEVAHEETEYKIAQLNKEEMSEKAYNAAVKELRLELRDTLKEIDDDEFARKQENEKKLMELELKRAEREGKAGSTQAVIQKQKDVWNKYYDTREQQLKRSAEMEIEMVNKSTASEEEKAKQIRIINARLDEDLYENKQQRAEKMISIDQYYVDELERITEQADRKVSSSTGKEKMKALEDRFNAEQALYAEQRRILEEQYAAGLISYQEYDSQRWEITKATEDSIAAYRQEKIQEVVDSMTTALGYMQEISDMVFDALASNVQAQMDALDEMYTTDVEEAKESATKRYISEKELADKKAKLEMKAAKYAKAQALINAGINTALAITSALTTQPFPVGIAMAAIAAAMGAAQIGIIASKPLAQYEKGRKGGKGEYALVGEKGPEIMYIPQGASIVPNHHLGDMAAWEKFGVPALPNDTLATAMMLHSMNIDYDKLGKAVAANIPQQKAVSVNVDRSGVTIMADGNRRTYLNHKYSGAWS